MAYFDYGYFSFSQKRIDKFDPKVERKKLVKKSWRPYLYNKNPGKLQAWANPTPKQNIYFLIPKNESGTQIFKYRHLFWENMKHILKSQSENERS